MTRPFSLVVTDSGLGGLAIAAGLVRRFLRDRPGRDLAITYFNAWPEAERGYNRIPDPAEQARAFDAALAGMERFRPDLILIACNTLSILYPRTAFARSGRVPVVDIMGFGLDLVLAHWRRRPESLVLLLGTAITIQSGAHAAGLRAQGVPVDRILAQPCHGLASLIESGPERAEVQELLGSCLDPAAARCPDRGAPLLAALCCTHFGYSLPAFRRALEARFAGPVTILDPNQAMVDGLAWDTLLGSAPGAGRLDLQVVSRIEWSAQQVAAIAAALEPVAPLAADALRGYRHDPHLF
ncbi:MAG: aspartate/glutamate racemase family protein [Holophaga sp.]|jgi:glutamate racemase